MKFEILKTVNMKNNAFSGNMTPCILVDTLQYISEERNFLLIQVTLLFHHVDRSDSFHGNYGTNLPIYTESTQKQM